MSEPHPQSQSQSIDLKNPFAAALLAWLLPGLGHFYQGRTIKGSIYFIGIVGLFVAGMALGEFKVVYWEWVSPQLKPESFRFPFLAQFFVGLPSFPALLQGTLQYHEIEPVLGGFMAKPDAATLNSLQQRQGRLVEIGNIYTMVAGLLNILAIFDAFGGPAYLAFDPEKSKTQTQPQTQAQNSSTRGELAPHAPSASSAEPSNSASDRKEPVLRLEAPLA